jgi:hypothetical protein
VSEPQRHCPAERHADDCAAFAALCGVWGRRIAARVWNEPTDAELWIANGPPPAREAKGVG